MELDIYHYVLKEKKSMCLSAKLLKNIFDENEDNIEVQNVEQYKADYWYFVQEAEHFVNRETIS